MRVIRDVLNATEHFPHTVVTVGSFDGVHLGHKCIVERVVAEARQHDGTPAVLTMEPHPRQYFAPDHAPNLLTTLEKKIALLDDAGIDVVYVLEFNENTANMPPEMFVAEVLHRRCQAKGIVVGHDCRFGKDAAGDIALLEHLADEFGYTVEQVPPLIINSERVSSTLIRERILQGDLDDAELFLGRKYSVSGHVIKGRGIGVKLGFPTANIRPSHSAIPAQGVYVAEVLIGGERQPAAVNIGIAPTIRHEDVTIEAHILDYDNNILGRAIEIVFFRRLRSEKKFPSYEALVDQIRQDVRDTRAYFVGQKGRTG